MKVSDVRKLKALEDETRWLKKLCVWWRLIRLLWGFVRAGDFDSGR
jgi:hypothetical protein